MAANSVSDFVSLINQQISSREELMSCLSKLEALLTFVQNSDLVELPAAKIHEYFWVLHDYISQAIKSNDDALDRLLAVDGVKTNHC